MSMEAIHAWKTFLIPKAKLLIIKCDEAEKVLDMSIKTSDAMVKAARKFSAMGAKGIMLRGGHVKDNSVTALLYYDGFKQFYGRFVVGDNLTGHFGFSFGENGIFFCFFFCFLKQLFYFRRINI